MGVQGAMSLMEEDPRRFGRPWRSNWGDAMITVEGKATDDDKAEEEGEKPVVTQEEPFILLVDGMSLLYHVAVNKQKNYMDSSPSVIKAQVYQFVSQLLEGIPPFSELRIFMDGLAPKTKLSTQIDRLRKQAIRGDVLAKKLQKSDGKQSNAKLMHLLAEWAMVEAVEDLCSTASAITAENGKILGLHRPSRGEAEPFIDDWIAKRIKPGTKVYILADDTDFLVYPNCPGFISFKSLEIQEDNGMTRLSGMQYVREKFLEAYLPTGGAANNDVMPVVAALSGCDYVLSQDSQEGMVRASNNIVKSDIGGLRQKARNNPSRAQRLTAILRFVAYHLERDKENWVEALCKAATSQSDSKRVGDTSMDQDEDNPSSVAAANLMDAFLSVRKTYFRSLTMPQNPAFEKKPSSMEIRRLLEYGILYCRPIIETWEPGSKKSTKKRSHEDALRLHSETQHDALIISPPFTRQIGSWIRQGSIWRMPIFVQARGRLYCLLVQFARKGGAYSFEGGQLRLSPMWTSEHPKVTEYVRTLGGKDGNGESTLKMHETEMDIQSYEYISAGWGDETELLSGNDAVDRACLFCILGNVKQAKPALNPRLRGAGMVLLTTLFLPYNLSMLCILLGTSPEFEGVDLEGSVEDGARTEMNRVFPFISVACHHAIFISSTILSLFGTHSDEQKLSNLTAPADRQGRPTVGLRVSDLLRYKDAIWIWNEIRKGPDLEELQSSESDDAHEMKFSMKFLDETIDSLANQLPETREWAEKVKNWKSRARMLWVIWWDVFNVALHATDSFEDTKVKDMNEWDKYILLLSRS
ncbi:expressed unknown protein [Seminavis robusta]|uniref:Uncharacterized protein n=1 Tax=Seminavis robusta TaxID=568900 RepID=A0A9N8DY21_9STRA|nr:expressed unknown protein [Seminavis robusta]|eukprot:Sro436_g142570.1 n/a (809) ;mRNA; f:16797-19322